MLALFASISLSNRSPDLHSPGVQCRAQGIKLLSFCMTVTAMRLNAWVTWGVNVTKTWTEWIETLGKVGQELRMILSPNWRKSGTGVGEERWEEMETVSSRGRERAQAGRGLCVMKRNAGPPQRHGGPDGNKGQVMQRTQAPKCAETHDLLGDGGALKSQDDVCVRGMAGPPTLCTKEDAQVHPGSTSSVSKLPSSLTR